MSEGKRRGRKCSTLDFVNAVRAVLRLEPIFETGDRQKGASMPVHPGYYAQGRSNRAGNLADS